MRIKQIFIVVSICLLLGCSFFWFTKKQHSYTQHYAFNEVPEVGVVTITPQPIKVTTELSGRVFAYIVAEVRPQVGGIIKKQFFCEGSNVQIGKLLYQINPAIYQANLDITKATLTKSEIILSAAKIKAERYKKLLAVNAISQQTYDDACSMVQQAEADTIVNIAKMEAARINLDYTKIVAPISGRIGRSSVFPGTLVTASQINSLVTIQQIDPIYVDLSQSSVDLLYFKNALSTGKLNPIDSGKKIRSKLILEDGSIYSLEGTLLFSEVNVDQGTGTILIRAIFPNPKQELLPGMYVRAIIEVGIDEQAILIPQQSVSRNNKGQAVVFILDSENYVELRIIETSRTIADKWLVSSGLKIGERVIIEGIQKIRPGGKAKAALSNYIG